MGPKEIKKVFYAQYPIVTIYITKGLCGMDLFYRRPVVTEDGNFYGGIFKEPFQCREIVTVEGKIGAEKRKPGTIALCTPCLVGICNHLKTHGKDCVSA